jgi:sugar lactone lactonase YvrE
MRNSPFAFSHSLALIAISVIAMTAGARAQTASFSDAITTVGNSFDDPYGVAVDSSGNVYVADWGDNAVYEMPAGCASFRCVTALGGGFSAPWGVAVDAFGDVYVADTLNNEVKVMPPGCSSSSCVNTVGGGFSSPSGVALDGGGNIYVTDSSNHAVKVMPPGCSSSGCVAALGGGFSFVTGVAVDSSDNVYVVDSGNGAVKEMPHACLSSSCVTTLGGGFSLPEGVAVDGSGNVYVADTYNNAVKEMPAGCSSSSCVTDLAGYFYHPFGVAVDGSGNVYVANSNNDSVNEIMTRAVNFFTVPVGNLSVSMTLTFTFNSAGSLSGTTPYQVLTQGAKNLDFNAAATQESNACDGITAYTAGETCTVNATFTPTKPGPRYGAVELLNAGGGTVATANVFGTGQGPQVVFSPAAQSTLGGGFSDPYGVAVDGSGNIYVANAGNGTVEEMPPACASSACVTSLGGGFGAPLGIAVDGSGNIYVADHQKHAVYEMPPGCASSACVTSLGGAIAGGSSVLMPLDVAVDGSGNIYVSDDNGWVEEMPPGCGSGTCMTLLGENSLGQSIFPVGYGIAVDGSGNVYSTGDGAAIYEMPPGCASSACVTALGGGALSAFGVAVDAGGNIYFVEPTPPYPGGNTVFEMPPGCASAACVTELGALPEVRAITVDGSGNIYVTGQDQTVVTEIQRANPPSLSFATTTVGSTSSDSPKTVQVANIGNQPLIFAAIGYSANFPENTGDTNLCAYGTPLAQGTSCDVSMSFKPTVAGAFADSVLLTDNNLNQTNATQSIALSGTAPGPAALTSPTPGSQLAGSSITFNWSAGVGVTHYWFNLGTGPSGVNAKNIYSGSSITATSVTVSGLPTNGETLYATLYSYISGAFQPIVYTFYATGPAVLTSPAAGTKLTASTTFTWTPGTGIAHYWFNLGTSATSSGAKNIYAGGSTTATSLTVAGIPQYGETLYATLYSYISGAWQPIVYTYTASGAPIAATLTTPTPSTKLASSSVTFAWSGSEGVTYYWFNLGTASSGANSKNLYSGSSTTLTSVTATGLPANGEPIFATLYSYIAGAWQPTVYTYTASGSPTPATLTLPSTSTPLASSTVTFTWSPGSGVTYFWLNVGTGTSGAAAKNLYSGSSTTATSVTVSGLPTNGEKIYATLYSYIGGAWQPTVYTFTTQ